MFNWLWRKSKSAQSQSREATGVTAVARVAPAVTTAMPGPRDAVAPTPRVAVSFADPVLKTEISGKRPTVKMQPLALSKPHAPTIGMPGRKIAGKLTKPVAVVAVQANGRTIKARVAGETRVRAFTLRADKSYRLAGAPDRSEPKLVLGDIAFEDTSKRASVRHH